MVALITFQEPCMRFAQHWGHAPPTKMKDFRHCPMQKQSVAHLHCLLSSVASSCWAQHHLLSADPPTHWWLTTCGLGTQPVPHGDQALLPVRLLLLLLLLLLLR
jgi:hypothetical protein